jgi:hypothetical protein
VLSAVCCVRSATVGVPFRRCEDWLAGAPDFSFLNRPLTPAARGFAREYPLFTHLATATIRFAFLDAQPDRDPRTRAARVQTDPTLNRVAVTPLRYEFRPNVDRYSGALSFPVTEQSGSNYPALAHRIAAGIYTEADCCPPA